MATHPDFEETRLFGDSPASPGSAPSGSTCAVGDLLAGRFRIVRFIARGGMGELYEAEDLELGERVALKAMRPEIAADEDANRRFRREVQLARQVTHPNICRIFDLFQHQPPGARPPVVFVTMELLEGETLAARLEREGRIPVDAAQRLVKPMVEALTAAHRLGIVHRDFKTSNVMLLDSPAGESRVVVTDFGIAYRVGEVSAAGIPSSAPVEILGTPDYMAPEQLDGQEVTASVDVYALGVVMYEMVTGERPFSTAAPSAASLRAVREAPPSPRSRVPELPLAWDMAILRCLSRRPDDRFPGVQAVLGALGVESDRAPEGRLMAVVIGVAAVVVMLVVLLGVFLSRERSDATPAAERAAGARITPRRSIAVLGFRNVSARDDEGWLATAFSEMLTTELAAGEVLRIVPSENVHRMKAELGIFDADSYGGEVLSLVHNRLQADLVVFGSFVAVGQGDRSIRLDVRVQDARVGQMLAQVSETGAESDVLTMVSQAGRSLRERLGVTPLTASAAQAVRALQPATPASARLYAEGLSRLRRFDALAARDMFEKAAAADPRFPLPHSALAMTWSTLGHDSRARDAARRAYELSAGLSREDRLIVEATYREMTSDWKEAVELNRTLATFFPDNVEYALRLANAEIGAGAYQEGLATVEGLRAQRPDVQDARIDLAEATAAEPLSDFKRMQAAAQRAIDTGTTQGARLLVARAKLLDGTALFRLGQLPAATKVVEEARAIYDDAGDRGGVARALNTLGSIAADGGDIRRGVALYEEGLKIARAIGNQNLAARFLNNLAIQERRVGNLDASLTLNQEALAIRREIGDRANLAISQNNIGNVLLDQGDLVGAAQHYREAADIHRETGDRRGVARSLHNAAVALRLQGELAPARATNEEALSIRRTIDDPASLATSLYGLAETIALQGDLAAAKRLFNEALDIQRRLKNQRPIGYLLYQLADIAWLEGDLTAARTLHMEALDIRAQLGEKGTGAETKVALALIDLEEGQPARAEQLAREAYEVFSAQKAPDNQSVAQAVMARALLAQGRRPQAVRQGQAARTLVRASANTLARIPALIAAACVEGIGGNNAEMRLASVTLQHLEQEARERGIVRYELDARLALAAIELRSSPDAARARLASIEKDARARDLGLYTRRSQRPPQS